MNSFHARQRKGQAASPTTGTAERSRRGAPRLDTLLVEQGLAASRTAARRLIADGHVRVGGITVYKPSTEVRDPATVSVEADGSDRYVSRGGLKLAGALAHLDLDVHGMSCLDVGQSTGGFTDCLLQAGAAKVVGVEVGHDQLHPRLRGDPRVVCIEGLNARSLSAEDLGSDWVPGGFDLLVCDASFISLTLLLARWPALLKAGGQVLALVKPQFEVGPQGLGKGGIVRDPRLYAEVEAHVRDACRQAGLELRDWFESTITGGDGNREFFLHARTTPNI